MDNNSSNTTFDNSTFEGWQAQQPPKSFWTNLTLPVIYLTLLVGSLYTFSSLYRKRQATKTAKLESWFPRNKQRDIYLSLLHLDPAEDASEGSEKKLSRVPDSILKAALLQRALEDIKRVMQLRASKPALQGLVQRGAVGDELWQRFLRAEQEIEEELKDVINEANAFANGWGQVIFQSASEMNTNYLVRDRMAELQSKAADERAWWDARRAHMQSSLLDEIGSDNATQHREDDGVLVEGGKGKSAVKSTASSKK